MIKQQVIEEMLEVTDNLIGKIEEAEMRDPDFSMVHEIANQLHEELNGLSIE